MFEQARLGKVPSNSVNDDEWQVRLLLLYIPG